MADLLVPFVAGQKDTASAHNAAHDITRMKYQSGDQTASTTAFVNSTFLVFTIQATVQYIFETQLFFDSNTTADFKINLLLPVGATVRWADAGAATATSTSTQRTYAATGAGNVLSANPAGLIDNDVAVGTLTLQFGQVVTSGTTILKIGSWIRLTQVSV
jgi:hypothetical protein